MRFVALMLIWFGMCGIVPAQEMKSPEAVYGFRMGADRQLVDWQQILDYLDQLGKQSPRVKLVELGQTTLKRRMVMAVISSAETIADLDKYRRIQQSLAQPYKLDQEGAEELVRKGKTVCLITMNIHSNEIAASQESLELAYELATGDDARIRHILDNVILLMVPSLNPDGQDMITKWYRGTVGTPFEGSRMPHKYHFYADHDNNRDWFFYNLAESRNTARVLYHDWYPEIVMDQHQMGRSGARFFLPPYADPVNPNVDPSLMAAVNMAGKHMISDMHDRGFTGLVTGTRFNAYFEGTMSKTPLWQNRIGILTEAASVHYASPIFFPKSSLNGMGIDLPEYAQQTNFLDPWPGGWWRLRDIVEYQKAAAMSLLDLSATFKDKFKMNFYRLNKSAIEDDFPGHPQAWVLPMDQADPGNVLTLLQRLRVANVAVRRAKADFSTAEGNFKAGDYILPLAQPARAYVKDLMEQQRYPNLREYPGGPPRQPYDVTAWTLPLLFGIEAVAVYEPLTVSSEAVESPDLAVDNRAMSAGWHYIDARRTDGYGLANRLLSDKYPLYRLMEPLNDAPAGSFLIKADRGNITYLKQQSSALSVPLVRPAEGGNDLKMPVRQVAQARIGIYQPWIANTYDEGWLRLVLDNFGFPYQVLHNADIQGNAALIRTVDVLIIASQDPEQIINGRSFDSRSIGAPETRRQYSGGIGSKGIDKIRQFMLDGGTALFLGEACDFAIESFSLPAENSLRGTDRDEFFIPGSILRMQLDQQSPLSYGLPASVPVYINNRLGLNLKQYHREITEAGYFGDHDLLMSGWAVGEEMLYGKVGLADIPVGNGRVILYAFRVQHRGQTYGTFKLLFNALYK